MVSWRRLAPRRRRQAGHRRHHPLPARLHRRPDLLRHRPPALPAPRRPARLLCWPGGLAADEEERAEADLDRNRLTTLPSPHPGPPPFAKCANRGGSKGGLSPLLDRPPVFVFTIEAASARKSSAPQTQPHPTATPRRPLSSSPAGRPARTIARSATAETSRPNFRRRRRDW